MWCIRRGMAVPDRSPTSSAPILTPVPSSSPYRQAEAGPTPPTTTLHSLRSPTPTPQARRLATRRAAATPSAAARATRARPTRAGPHGEENDRRRGRAFHSHDRAVSGGPTHHQTRGGNQGSNPLILAPPLRGGLRGPVPPRTKVPRRDGGGVMDPITAEAVVLPGSGGAPGLDEAPGAWRAPSVVEPREHAREKKSQLGRAAALLGVVLRTTR